MTTKLGLGTDVTIQDGGRDLATGETVLPSGEAPSRAQSQARPQSQPSAQVRPSAPAVGSGSAPAGQPARGDSIGRFVVLGLLGSGGMGNVYSGYDPHLDRKVAIKLLHTEIARTNASDARTRLLREAQAMAKIDHPNVIKVHEVGTFGDQVYVAMEFADGGTLRAWLKARTRTRRDVIDRFAQAGRGLAAAHAAGLVHRDFKPDNVLLAKDGSVRVTDFGLVSVMAEPQPRRAPTSDPAQEPTAIAPIPEPHITPLSQNLTRTGSVMGTPSYMAPEQFLGQPATARTDQFAFCISLYEALYGERPFAGDTFNELAVRVTTGEVRPAPKGTNVPGWVRRVLVRGLARAADDRFPSMDALLAALARDPARRRRTVVAIAAPIAVAAAGVAALALSSGGRAACGTGLDRTDAIWNAKRRADLEAAFRASGRPLAQTWLANASHQLDAWTAAWQAAYRDACEATHVRGDQSEHLLDLRMQCLTRRLGDAGATIDQLVAGGPEAIDHALQAVHALPSLAPCADTASLLAAVPPPDDPVAAARVAAVRTQLGTARALDKLGKYQPALVAARGALAAARATGYAPVIAEAGVVLGGAQYDAGDQGASDTLREAMHTAAAAGDEDTQIDAAAWLVFTLAVQKADYAAADELGSLAEAVVQHARPPVEKVVRLEDAIGQLDLQRKHVADAQARFEKALALAAPLGEDHDATLTTLNQLATAEMDGGKLEDARKTYERVLAARERLYGKDHPDVAAALNNVGNVYRRESKYDEARQVFERALAIRIAALGPEHPEVATTYLNLGTFEEDVGDRDAARHSYERALAIWQKAYGPNSVHLAMPLVNLGAMDADDGNFATGRARLDRARQLIEAAKGKDSPDLVDVLTDLGNLESYQHHLDTAMAEFQQAQQIAEKAYGPDHPDVADVLGNEATIYKAQHKYAEAAELTDHILHVYEKAYGPDHPRVGQVYNNLGNLEDARGDHKAALAAFQKSLAIFEAKLGKDHEYVSYPLIGIAEELDQLHQPHDAVPYYERALAIRTAAKMRPELIAEVQLGLGEVLGKLPGAANLTRARSLVEAALAGSQQGGNDANVAEAKHWLASHH